MSGPAAIAEDLIDGYLRLTEAQTQNSRVVYLRHQRIR